MRQTGALPVLLPGSDDRWLSMLVHFEQMLGLEPDWLVRLAALGGASASGRPARPGGRRVGITLYGGQWGERDLQWSWVRGSILKRDLG